MPKVSAKGKFAARSIAGVAETTLPGRPGESMRPHAGLRVIREFCATEGIKARRQT